MTLNDQHILMAEQAIANAADVTAHMQRCLDILKSVPPSRKNPLAKQIGLLNGEVARKVNGACAAAELLERTLSYSRMGDEVGEE